MSGLPSLPEAFLIWCKASTRLCMVAVISCAATGAITLMQPAIATAQDPFGDTGGADNPFGTSAGDASDSASPFGGFGQPVAPAADAPADSSGAAASAVATDDANPVVRLLRESPPQTPKQMAEGLSWVVRIKRWDEVKRLLDEIAAKKWSLAQMAELADAGEPAMWLRLSGDEAEVSDEQRLLLETIGSAQAKLASDPSYIDGWIEKLALPQAGDRRLAQLRLRAGGAVAIERLLARLLAGDATVDAGMLAGTIAESGSQGADALRAACLLNDPQRAGRVYLGIAEIPGSDFATEIAAGLASRTLSNETRSALAEVIHRRFSKLPSPDEIGSFLQRRFDDQLGEYQQERATSMVAVGETEVAIWRPTSDGQSVQAVQGSREEQQLEALARVAAQRLNLDSSTSDALVDCGAVVLQRAYRVRPGLAFDPQHKDTLADFAPVLADDANYWVRVFDRASELQLHGGAVRAVQMLEHSAAGHYLVPLDFLTRLLGDSRPGIRYLALQQIAAIDPQQSFAGAEKSLQVAVEMARLSSGPRGLVVGMSAELRQAAQQQLEQQASAQVTTAHSARAALLALDGSEPFELVLVVDRVADQSIYELVQRLRAAERGRALPIAVMTDELYQHERRLIAETPGVVASQLSRTPQHMQAVINQLVQRLDTRPFSAEERNSLARSAGDFLARVSGERERYAFYPISDIRSELQELNVGLPIATRLAVLVGMGTGDSQQQLVALCSNASLTAAERLQAAQSFQLSVKRFGMNLTREQVLRVYDGYNVLGPSDSATAQSLGMVLDTIESR